MHMLHKSDRRSCSKSRNCSLICCFFSSMCFNLHFSKMVIGKCKIKNFEHFFFIWQLSKQWPSWQHQCVCAGMRTWQVAHRFFSFCGLQINNACELVKKTKLHKYNVQKECMDFQETAYTLKVIRRLLLCLFNLQSFYDFQPNLSHLLLCASVQPENI